jgi:RimJ/RimL family protein N-acetyltransferase
LGPDIISSRVLPVEGRDSHVLLGGFSTEEADRLFPFTDDDPAITHMGAYFGGQMLTRSSSDLVVPLREGANQILWGIRDEASTLTGFAWVSYYPKEGNKHVGLSLLLSEQGRGRGIGALATAGVLNAAMQPGVLHAASGVYPSVATDMDTFIHPVNLVSRGLCTSFGFKRVGERRLPGCGRVMWDHYVLPAERTQSRQQLTFVQYVSARSILAKAIAHYSTTVL